MRIGFARRPSSSASRKGSTNFGEPGRAPELQLLAWRVILEMYFVLCTICEGEMVERVRLVAMDSGKVLALEAGGVEAEAYVAERDEAHFDGRKGREAIFWWWWCRLYDLSVAHRRNLGLRRARGLGGASGLRWPILAPVVGHAVCQRVSSRFRVYRINSTHT